MVHQALGSFKRNNSPQPAAISPQLSRHAPSLGLRGGLGKTLLIAFLLLAIVPLGLLSFLTYNQIQSDTGKKVSASLDTMVALKEAHLVDWVESYERELALLVDASSLDAGTPASKAEFLAARLAAFQAVDPTLTALILVDDSNGQLIAAPDSARMALPALQPGLADERRLVLATVPRDNAAGGETTAGSETTAGGGTTADLEPLLAVSLRSSTRRLIGLLSWNSMQQIIIASDGLEAGVSTWLVTEDGLMASSNGLNPLPDVLSLSDGKSLSQGMVRALQGKNGSGAYTGVGGIPVFGAYRWIPDLGVALLAEQSRTAALVAGNTVTAMIVGATLAVALITAAIAAVVTRRLTLPIVQLTETAAWMARGNLNQKVTVTRKDEIGVLARAFNRMAAELRILYGELEAKVAERTQQLEEAHERSHYYAMQLSISAEVARVASSIRNLDELFTTVVKLIGDAFELHHVAIYLLDSSNQRVTWQAGSNGLIPFESELVGGPTLVGQVAADGQRRVRGGETIAGGETTADDCRLRRGAEPPLAADSSALGPLFACEMAVPLRSRRQMLGVLHLQGSRADDFDSSDEMVYQSLADQISIAIENARAYAVEHDTVKRLQELDQIQSQFLTNMSHALRTPLNSVIGFSRIMLKGLDGPLTDLQRADLETVYKSGRQLLGLINDMLELTQLELGTASFSLAAVDLAEIIEGVMATARALGMSKPVQLYLEVPEDLPLVCTDGQRVRQVILALLSNAVKYTDEGSIHLRAARDDGHITISVHDTGMGIPPEERSRIFADPQHDEVRGETATPGFGLAISRRVVEKLGGQIWVESVKGSGSIFTFTLPIRPEEESMELNG
jgi:signal transduction histidine kinase/HAMP domain-containing protein